MVRTPPYANMASTPLFLSISMHLFQKKILPAWQEFCSCCLCKACCSLGQKRGNERAITGRKIILTSPLEKISKTANNSTAKPRNISLQIYQKRLEILLVYIKEWLTLYKVFNVSSFCHNPIPQV